MRNSIKILGAFGSKGEGRHTTCIQIDKHSVIDAGNVVCALGNKAIHINNIYLTHTHLDHIIDISFLVDIFFTKRKKPLKIYALEKNIEILKNSIFNWDIWPDFSTIYLEDNVTKSLEFVPINIGEILKINATTTLEPIQNNHTQSSCGYIISKNNNSILFTSDTYKCKNIWNKINNNKNIKSLLIDVSFPSRFDELAKYSKHLTPKTLKDELLNLKRNDISIFINHLKPSFVDEIKKEIVSFDIDLGTYGGTVSDNDVINLSSSKKIMCATKQKNIKKDMQKLIKIGQSLSSQKNITSLLQGIMLGAKTLSNADGGTLYLMNEQSDELKFTIVQTSSLGIKMGGDGDNITWPNLGLKNKDQSENRTQVACVCALDGELINIKNIYKNKKFDFSGTRKFDKNTGYKSLSMLVVPMKNHENKTIGVLQLLNKINNKGNIIDFNKDDEELILSLASQAAIAISNIQLIEGLNKLLDSFIKSIATAVGAKSKYTGGHINKVAEITNIITNAVNKDTEGVFKDINFSENEMKEMDIAAWMHDVGKITTPEYVVDKSKKLETIYDRINVVKMKFEILKKDLYIEFLQAKTKEPNKEYELRKKYDKQINQAKLDYDFICDVNFGSEFLDDDKIDKIIQISNIKINIDNKIQNLLSDDEAYNLSIKKGTLTQNERDIINNHANMSYYMLKDLPFPKKYENIPLIASSHHKRVSGGGYGAIEIMDIAMSFKDKILAIADVFEALSASDRPYKKPNTLSQCLDILRKMVDGGDLDSDLVDFFIDKKLYEDYAKHNLSNSQLD